jgi:hypothetical protein
VLEKSRGILCISSIPSSISSCPTLRFLLESRIIPTRSATCGFGVGLERSFKHVDGKETPEPDRKKVNKKVLFLQLEVFLNCAPHLGMCLFIDDLRQEGITCTTYVVNCNHIDELLPLIKEGGFTLICLESSFTVEIINQLMTQFPEIPILVGGVNSIALFLHTDIPFAVHGPGRRSIKEFMAQFYGAKDFSKVTNLFFKTGRKIHYSGLTQHWDLAGELFPYKPYLDWQYLGPERRGNANTGAVSIIAGTGCPYSRSVKRAVEYDVRGTINRLGYDVSEIGLKRLKGVFNRRAHGCSFCVFQLQDYTSYPVAKTTDLLLRQAQYLYETHKTTAFHIPTENPFPFLNDFLGKLLKQTIPLDFVSIRTRPDTLLKQKVKLLKALDTAKDYDFHFSIEEVGFESFVEEELLLFNKGVSVKTNLGALALLRETKQMYEQNLSVHVGHGIILFHPWATLDSITKNLRVMAAYSDIFRRFYALNLTLYSEFLPIFCKVADEGLALSADSGYGWDYSWADPLAKKAFELYRALFSFFGPDMSIPAFLNALNLVRDRSVDEILAQEYNLIPVQE